MKKFDTVTFAIDNYVKKMYPSENDYAMARLDMMTDISDLINILLRNKQQIQIYDDDGNGNVIVVNFNYKDPEYGIALEWIDTDAEYIENYNGTVSEYEE